MNENFETYAIHAAQRGSEQAWRQLFEQHFDAVYRFCSVLTCGRHNVAEEMTQQVFIIAARRILHFDPKRATFRAWLFGIVKNRNMTMQAKEQRRKQYEEFSAKDNSQAVNQEGPDLRVHEALARLPWRYRVVLEAKYLRGLSMKEIAADNGASIEAIESLLSRARASFGRVYKQMQTSE